MIKYEVKNRYTGNVQFTAEIDCDDNALTSIKLGLAVKWAIKNKANLQGADLQEANLQGAYLRWADLQGAYLRWADLQEVDLQGANLQGADLYRADLRGADLRGADLYGADLYRADLRGADLQRTNLLYYKTDRYDCYIQTQYLQIGCELHTWDRWLSFDDTRIIEIDGKDALKWWRVNKPILEAIRDSIEVAV